MRFFDEVGISGEGKRKVYHGNAERIFRIQPRGT
jgi:predicted TIM-barrel fold metal-dependent hydrolase